MRKIKKKIKIALIKIKIKIQLYCQKKIFVSFGENCLTDNILERHKLKLLTTPFSHGRSNVEYILQLERDNYKDFLNPNYLQYEMFNEKKVPRLKKYNQIHNDYNELHKNGFEFTHHDVIKDESARIKLKQRLDKLQNLIGKKKFIILYHHRVNSGTNMEQLTDNLCELKQLYSKNKIKSEVVCFTQNIITDIKDRKISYKENKEIHFFVFNTINEWEGDNQNVFWARCDDDLLSEMVYFIKKL